MPPDPLIVEILQQVLGSTHTINRRFAPVHSVADFVSSDEGMDRLDAICMQLIALGESIKNLDKVSDGKLLPQYPEIEWKRIMGMRDVISHHYFDLNAEVVVLVCQKHIPALMQQVERMLRDEQDK
jgi:uncharacterized protein with HEPN domain